MAYSSIVKPTDYFNTVLYTGTGSENAITGVEFQPDFAWLKRRDSTGSHRFFDSVRGATKEIFSDANLAESTTAQSLKSFDTDGFTMGTDAATNGSSRTFVAWNWLAGGSSTTNPSGGTITTTASVNTTAGFSVFTYTGNGSAAHLAHGLGVAPTVVIIKGRSNTDHWFVKHPGIASNEYLYLNLNNAKTSGVNVWSATNPDATKIYVGTDAGVNGSGVTYVCYAFAEKQGYSKFGSYTGNGNADGTFVYTGFKPAFVMVKCTSDTDNWNIHDSVRNEFNLTDNILYPNLSNAEGNPSVLSMDLLSQGFKFRGSDGGTNGSGRTYIYMAFAEEPFVGNDSGTAVPVTAR